MSFRPQGEILVKLIIPGSLATLEMTKYIIQPSTCNLQLSN